MPSTFYDDCSIPGGCCNTKFTSTLLLLSWQGQALFSLTRDARSGKLTHTHIHWHTQLKLHKRHHHLDHRRYVPTYFPSLGMGSSLREWSIHLTPTSTNPDNDTRLFLRKNITPSPGVSKCSDSTPLSPVVSHHVIIIITVTFIATTHRGFITMARNAHSVT